MDLTKLQGEEALWAYNCKDCVYTREVGEVELETAKTMGLEAVHERQQKMFWPVLKAMLKGVRIDQKMRQRLIAEVSEQVAEKEALLYDLVGYNINPRSSDQMQELFYEVFKQPVIMSRAKKNVPAHPTCDDDALKTIAKREPLLKPIVDCISDIRTLGVFLSHFLLKPLDVDGRMRCSYNIGGSESGKSAPKTYRLSSNENAFGSGTNLMNIPSEKSKSVGKALARAKDSLAALGDPLSLPNLRAMFIPDPGYEFFDGDLDRADLQVMAWDADEPLLKATLRMGADIHLVNAFVLDGKDPPPLEELVETHPKYPDHRGPLKHKREFAKVFCHATDYLGKARTVAAATGRTVHETERAQAIYLGTYKGIKKWQDRVIEEVRKRRYVENRFGYRWYIFDRIDDQVMPEAVAWIPQSTVSIVINAIWQNIYDRAKEVDVLLQTHDSLSGQYPIHLREACLAKIRECAQVVVPYEDPLVIPFGIATSLTSWGECA